jgi:hypothetical protein
MSISFVFDYYPGSVHGIFIIQSWVLRTNLCQLTQLSGLSWLRFV